MALLISPIMLALVVIIALELLVMILSIIYLLWRGHEGENISVYVLFTVFACVLNVILDK